MTMKGGYVAVGAVALLLVGGWFGAFYKDHTARHNESVLRAQANALQTQIAAAQSSTAEAQRRADAAEIARKAAEKTAQASALDADIAYANYMEKRNSVTANTTAPAELDALPVINAEHTARVDCSQALQAANQEIEALEDVKDGLTTQVSLVTARANTSDAALKVVTDDRDTQLKRKKIWRGVAGALGAIGLAALLF